MFIPATVTLFLASQDHPDCSETLLSVSPMPPKAVVAMSQQLPIATCTLLALLGHPNLTQLGPAQTPPPSPPPPPIKPNAMTSYVCVCEHRYELCNQYGIYLMDEANVETHGFEPSFTKKNAHPACWPEWHDAIVDRGVRMVSPAHPTSPACLAITVLRLTLPVHTVRWILPHRARSQNFLGQHYSQMATLRTPSISKSCLHAQLDVHSVNVSCSFQHNELEHEYMHKTVYSCVCR